MIAIISSMLGCSAILKKRSRFIYIILFIFLWSIMAFTYGNADEDIYISRYQYPEIWENQTEFLYMMIIKFSLFLGLSYQSFKSLIVLVQLCLISSTILKFSKCPNIVILLYSIFPFVVDVAQMRNALATSIMIFSLQFLMNTDKNNRLFLSKNEIKFIICIIIASFIHTASIIWLLLLIAKKCRIKTVISYTILCFITFSYIITPNVVVWLAEKFGATARIGAYASSEYIATRDLYFNSAIIRVIFFATTIILIYSYILYVNKAKENRELLILGLKCNIIILCILPVIINYTPEVYRMQVGLSLLNYIIITNCLNIKYESSGKIVLKNMKISLYLIIISIINLYFLVLGNDNFYTVFMPIFKNNCILDIFR